jgi:tyrosine-protein kinase Etk/Wzc
MAPTTSEGPVKLFSEVERESDARLALAGGREISLLDLLIVLARNLKLIGTVALGMAVVGVVLAMLLPSRYTATTSILPPQQNSASGSALMAQLGSLGSVASLAGGGLGLKNPNDLQVALLKSRTVEDAMIDRFHLVELYRVKRRSSAESMLENVVSIDSGAKDGLIRLSVTDADPRRAADMANGYVDEFRRFSATLAVTEASQRRLFFEQQLSQAKDNLSNAEQELKKTEQKTGLIQLDAQGRALIEAVAQLRAQIAAKQVQIRAMESFATGENPQLETARQELAGLEAEESKMGATGGADAPLVPKGVMQESGLEYVRRIRDVKYYETIFDLIARQYEAAKVDEAKQGAIAQVVDLAIVPDHRSSPKRTLIVLGAVILGVIFGIVWAFGDEAMDRISKNPAERSRLESLKASLPHRA